MIKPGDSNLWKYLDFVFMISDILFLVQTMKSLIVKGVSSLIFLSNSSGAFAPTDLMNSEIIHFPRSHRSPPVRSFHLAYALCTGWIDFTLFGFDNHVYCAMKCGVAEGWQYPSTRGNLLTAGARWRYSLAQERSAHSDTTASVCATGSLAVIYDASRAITLSLTLIQQFIYCHACIRAEVSFLLGGWGGCNQLVPHT